MNLRIRHSSKRLSKVMILFLIFRIAYPLESFGAGVAPTSPSSDADKISFEEESVMINIDDTVIETETTPLFESAVRVNYTDVPRYSPEEIQTFEKLGEEVVKNLDPHAVKQLFGVYSRLAARLHEASRNPTLTTAELNDPEVAQLMLESQRILQNSIEQKSKTPPNGSKTKTRLSLAFLGVASAGCSIGGFVVDQEWAKALLLAGATGFLYGSNSVVGPLTKVPSDWPFIAQMLLQALVGASLVYPGNVINFINIANMRQPGSTVNVNAVLSVKSLVSGLVASLGSALLFGQPTNWTVWVGIAATGMISVLQLWYALQYPTPTP